jgi:hypothetical protein
VHFHWNAKPGIYPVTREVRKSAEAAGVYFYASDGVCAWENASMLLVQGDAPEVTLDRPRKGVEMFSGRPFSTDASRPLAVPNPGSPALLVWEPNDFNT